MTDCTDDLVLLSNKFALAEYLLYCLEQAAESIDLNMNAK